MAVVSAKEIKRQLDELTLKSGLETKTSENGYVDFYLNNKAINRCRNNTQALMFVRGIEFAKSMELSAVKPEK